MAKITIDTEMRVEPPVMNGTLMIHKDHPPFVVMATGIVVGDEFAGVALETGAYGDQWIIDEFGIFEGKITLEQ